MSLVWHAVGCGARPDLSSGAGCEGPLPHARDPGRFQRPSALPASGLCASARSLLVTPDGRFSNSSPGMRKSPNQEEFDDLLFTDFKKRWGVRGSTILAFLLLSLST